jgi:aerobic-type carbon monoxide dehydrogenase small subunit (CoxS/CutS family)
MMRREGKKALKMDIQVNGKRYSVDADGRTNLLQILRENLDLTGSKYGCGEGMCGACTVMMDGAPVRSCITPLASTQGKNITTIEGLNPEGELNQVQKAFLEVDAFQCGYCAPGMVMSSVALLKKNPKPSRKEIEDSLHGNICRCGTYPRLLKAIQKASNT